MVRNEIRTGESVKLQGSDARMVFLYEKNGIAYVTSELSWRDDTFYMPTARIGMEELIRDNDV